jgi:hypothetical protein
MNLSIIIVLFFRQVVLERDYGHYIGNVIHFFWISYSLFGLDVWNGSI